MLEPENNPNPSSIVDPPRLFRFLIAKYMRQITNKKQVEKKRVAAEKKRLAGNHPHQIEYFHQLDDPYSHLTAQVIARFAARYDVQIIPHLIHATGGKNQPEQDKLAAWARRDAELVAPHYGLNFPAQAGLIPSAAAQQQAAAALAKLSAEDFLKEIEGISSAMWQDQPASPGWSSALAVREALDKGTARLAKLGHYSGATFYYGGEWYWGVDRLFHLEQRLRTLGACLTPEAAYLVPRPAIDLTGVDASGLELHFFPSLNSPYTAIIYDKTIALADACKIRLYHKPVLPMVMRGVPVTREKTHYILFDTWREANFLGVPFGDVVPAIGTPTRQAYSLLPWAGKLGKDRHLLSTLLRYAWAEGRGLHKLSNIRCAVEEAGLPWAEASKHLDGNQWKAMIESNQQEMVNGMGFWGVPCYKLCGPENEPDLAVWGQDRLWLVAAEIRRRTELAKTIEYKN